MDHQVRHGLMFADWTGGSDGEVPRRTGVLTRCTDRRSAVVLPGGAAQCRNAKAGRQCAGRAAPLTLNRVMPRVPICVHCDARPRKTVCVDHRQSFA